MTGTVRATGAVDAGPHASRLRLTRRGRAVLILLAALALGALVLVVPGLLDGATAEAPAAPVAVEIYSVSPGESMWQIASAVSDPGADVRDTIDEILELNGLASVDLQIGQQLLLPVRG